MTSGRDTQRGILLVEDNETIRQAFRILLEDSGFRVTEAASGAEAIEAVKDHRPDLVLMDLGLPDMGGLEATRRLKADPMTADTVILAITGRALETDHAACIDAGCAGYLAKPIDTERLFRKIEEVIGL